MRRNLYPLLVVLALGTIAYLPSLRNGFVYDDEYTVVRNSLIKSLRRLPHLVQRDYFTLSAEQSYRPVVTLSYFLDYALSGLKPFGYHLTNLLLHLAVVSILFLFLTEIVSRGDPETRYRYAPFMAAAIFAVHPINSEAVNCVSYREDLLCAFWYLLAMLLYVKGRGYGLSLMCFGLALLSKEMAVTLPAMVILCDLFLRPAQDGRGGLGKMLGRYAGYAAVLAAYAVVAFGVMRGEAPRGEGLSAGGLYSAALMKPWVVACDLGSFFYPMRLSAEYVVTEPAGVLAAVLPLGFALLFALLIWLLGSRGGKLLAFGFVWFFVALLPVSGVYPIFNIRADRYLYLPSMGLCLAVALILNLPGAVGLKRRASRLTVAVFVSLILLYLVKEGRARTAVWGDDLILWSDALAKAGAHPRAYVGRANAFVALGRYGDAIGDCTEAIRLMPSFPEAYYNRGLAYHKKGENDQAIRDFDMVLKLVPDHRDSLINRGNSWTEKGRYEKAIADFDRAVRLAPESADAYNNRGAVYGDRGDYERALVDFNHALRLDPRFPGAYYNRATVYFFNKDYTRALDDYVKAHSLGYEVDPSRIEDCRRGAAPAK